MPNERSYFKDDDGTQYWYLDGEYHREDGPAVMFTDGYTMWYQHGKKHREGGPAISKPDGTKVWYYCGQRHRMDGPASIYPEGHKCWYIFGLRVTSSEQFQKRTGCSDEFLTYLILTYGEIK